jgi:hypothetical protein
MRQPIPTIADQAPSADNLTGYDREHLVIYVRLLDAEADGADWSEVARIVLQIDHSQEPLRTRRAWESHLARAKWMTERGYRHLLPSHRAVTAPVSRLYSLRSSRAPDAHFLIVNCPCF